MSAELCMSLQLPDIESNFEARNRGQELHMVSSFPPFSEKEHLLSLLSQKMLFTLTAATFCSRHYLAQLLTEEAKRELQPIAVPAKLRVSRESFCECSRKYLCESLSVYTSPWLAGSTQSSTKGKAQMPFTAIWKLHTSPTNGNTSSSAAVQRMLLLFSLWRQERYASNYSSQTSVWTETKHLRYATICLKSQSVNILFVSPLSYIFVSSADN